MRISMAALIFLVFVAVAKASLNGADMSPGVEVPQQTSYGLVDKNPAPEALRAAVDSHLLAGAAQANGVQTRAKRPEVEASHAALPFVTRPGAVSRDWTLAISDSVSNVNAPAGGGVNLKGFAIGGIIAAAVVVLTIAVWAATRYFPGRPARFPRRVDTEQRGIELPTYKPRARTGEVVLEHDLGRTPAYDIARSSSPAPMGEGEDALGDAPGRSSPSLRRRTR